MAKILFVENDPTDVARFTRIVKQELGHNMGFADSVQAAEFALLNNEFDLIICTETVGSLGDGVAFAERLVNQGRKVCLYSTSLNSPHLTSIKKEHVYGIDHYLAVEITKELATNPARRDTP